MTDFQKDDIMQRLAQLDDDLLSLYSASAHFEMVIVGGAAFMVMGLAPQNRFTTDIDVLKASDELEALLESYDMNTDVATFLYKYPENWEHRRRKIPFDSQVLDVYTLSNEDLAITKLLAWRETDKKDLVAMIASDNLNLDAVEHILSDATEVEINLDESEWNLLIQRFVSLRKDILL